MKRIIFFMIVVITVMSIASCGIRYNTSSSLADFIMIESEAPDIYTEPSFQNMMKTSGYTPSIVVRNSVASGSNVSSNSNAARIVTIMESGLLRNKIDVRDRALFDRVMTSYSENNQSINYVELGEKTQTDLLFEITDYTIDDFYEVKTYFSDMGNVPFKRYSIPDDSDPKGKRKRAVTPSYEFRGMSIEIKVIVLKDNTIGGTYRYFYVPCAAQDGGCEIISFGGYNFQNRQFIPLKYRYGKNQQQDVDDIMGGNYDNNSRSNNRRTTREERVNQAMSNFITDEVIPSMLAHMKGETYQKEELISDMRPVRQRQNPNLNLNPDIDDDDDTSTAQDKKTIALENKNKLLQQQNKNKLLQQQGKLSQQNSNDNMPPVKTGPSKNSYYTAQSVSNLISKQLSEQESKSKKPKGGTTDEEKLRNLKPKAIITVDQFITSSVTSVGSVPEESATEITIYSESNSKPSRQDFSLLCFVDNKCIGVGSSAKGIFTSFAKDLFEFGFHTLSMGICQGDSYIELFNSQIDFSIKNNFFFELNGRNIKLAN